MDKTSVQHCQNSQIKKLAWLAPEVTIITTEQTDGKFTSPGETTVLGPS